MWMRMLMITVFVASSVAVARDIAVVDLPKNVSSAIQKAHAGAKLVKAEEEMEDGQKQYEVLIENKDSTRKELKVRADGTILEAEKSE